MKTSSDTSDAATRNRSHDILLFIIAVLLFPPAAFSTLIIYIVLRALRCPRQLCMVAAVSVGAVLALGQIVLMAAVIITGEPLF